MFWKLSPLSASSPVEAVLDKENFTLEELLDEEEIIQECKAMNSRLLNFLREKTQIAQLLQYIVEEPPENADNKRVLKFPFVSCEIITCEIDAILKTLVEDEELMTLLFSFLTTNHSCSPLLAGYFGKVVVCLMLRKTVPLMNFVQNNQYIFQRLVDLIGITSIMEILVRILAADDHMYPNYVDVMQWLSDSNLLEMIVDKLSPHWPPAVHANAAETLCAITRNTSSVLAAKLRGTSFVERIFSHALEQSMSKSALIYSLTVLISLLDPKRSTFILAQPVRSQNMSESSGDVKSETVTAILPKIGNLLTLLNVSVDETMLPTTFGQLRPPLGKHRLKIVEFIAVLFSTSNGNTKEEVVSKATIQKVLDLFFDYPYNNSLHHHVENIILSCLESKSDTIVDYIFQECDLIGKIIQADKNPILSSDINKPTMPASGKHAPRTGNLGHITRISNKLVQLGNNSSRIQSYLQESAEWCDWQVNVLQERNGVENVYRWACGRPSALQDRTRDSDEDEIHEKDYDVAALANNLSQAFKYNIYRNDEDDEDHEGLNHPDEDGYFDDESAEVVISSLRLDDQGSLFTNSNWFAFQDERVESGSMSTSVPEVMDEINLNGGNSGSDDEVVVGEDEDLADTKASKADLPETSTLHNGLGSLDDMADFSDRPTPGWATWEDTIHLQVRGSGTNPFEDDESLGPNSPETPTKSPTIPSLFEDDVEFVGVELEGTEKAMDHALKEGIVGEAGPLKKNAMKKPSDDGSDDDASGMKEFNDANYWRVEQEVTVLE